MTRAEALEMTCRHVIGPIGLADLKRRVGNQEKIWVSDACVDLIRREFSGLMGHFSKKRLPLS